jgi:tryptophan synthase alpha chain
MSRLDDVFVRSAAKAELALIAYLTAGYPTPDETLGLVSAAVAAGADIVELGVPFSDPMGDGPVIQGSSEVALSAGMTVGRALESVAELRRAGIDVPIVLMGYCNPFLRYGVQRLFADACVAGVDGFVIPDLPPQEADEWLDAAGDHELDIVFFAAPGTPPERLSYSAARSGGFLYCLAAEGVTGTRSDLDPRLFGYLARVRAGTDMPLAVGFGISRPEHVRALHGHADGVIVGSAIVRRITEGCDRGARIAAVGAIVSELKSACR